MIGPSHSRAINTSVSLFPALLKGAYPAVMAMTWGFVAVRDVAAAHLAVFCSWTGPRFVLGIGRYLCISICAKPI